MIIEVTRFFLIDFYLRMFRQSKSNHNNTLKQKKKRNYTDGGNECY